MECSDKEWQHCRVEKMGCEGCIYNEKTADEMFEELEYKLYELDNDGELILYYEKIVDKKRMVINFWRDKTVSKGILDTYITMQELQAIYKKCQELGWIEDE